MLISKWRCGGGSKKGNTLQGPSGHFMRCPTLLEVSRRLRTGVVMADCGNLAASSWAHDGGDGDVRWW